MIKERPFDCHTAIIASHLKQHFQLCVDYFGSQSKSVRYNLVIQGDFLPVQQSIDFVPVNNPVPMVHNL